MRKPVLMSALVTVVLMTGARAEPALVVCTSVLPIQTFVENIGGKRADARMMLLPGQSPATQDPTPG